MMKSMVSIILRHDLKARCILSVEDVIYQYFKENMNEMDGGMEIASDSPNQLCIKFFHDKEMDRLKVNNFVHQLELQYKKESLEIIGASVEFDIEPRKFNDANEKI